MKIAVVGSRGYSHQEAVLDMLNKLLAMARNGGQTLAIVSGGAQGPDLIAQKWAEANGVPVEVFPADWEQHGDSAGIKRNALIVQACDSVLAYWDGSSAGTLDTICRAKKAGKPVSVFLG